MGFCWCGARPRANARPRAGQPPRAHEHLRHQPPRGRRSGARGRGRQRALPAGRERELTLRGVAGQLFSHSRAHARRRFTQGDSLLSWEALTGTADGVAELVALRADVNAGPVRGAAMARARAGAAVPFNAARLGRAERRPAARPAGYPHRGRARPRGGGHRAHRPRRQRQRAHKGARALPAGLLPRRACGCKPSADACSCDAFVCSWTARRLYTWRPAPGATRPCRSWSGCARTSTPSTRHVAHTGLDCAPLCGPSCRLTAVVTVGPHGDRPRGPLPQLRAGAAAAAGGSAGRGGERSSLRAVVCPGALTARLGRRCYPWWGCRRSWRRTRTRTGTMSRSESRRPRWRAWASLERLRSGPVARWRCRHG